MATAVDFPRGKSLLSFYYCAVTTIEIPKISPVLCVRKPVASFGMYFVIAVWLGVMIDVIECHLSLLSTIEIG